MEKNILIVHHTLGLGGGEKLVYELSKFYVKNNIKISIFIPNILHKEYYDDKLLDIGIKILRGSILPVKKNLISKYIFNNIYWRFYLKYFLKHRYDSIIFVNLSSASGYHRFFNHNKKLFWHVGNRAQYPQGHFDFDTNIFHNSGFKLVLINRYQKLEIEKQYGEISSEIIYIKLFENE